MKASRIVYVTLPDALNGPYRLELTVSTLDGATHSALTLHPEWLDGLFDRLLTALQTPKPDLPAPQAIAAPATAGEATAPSVTVHDPRNVGHGHVRPRPDDVRASCGGPGICVECSQEQSALVFREQLRKRVPLADDLICSGCQATLGHVHPTAYGDVLRLGAIEWFIMPGASTASGHPAPPTCPICEHVLIPVYDQVRLLWIG